MKFKTTYAKIVLVLAVLAFSSIIGANTTPIDNIANTYSQPLPDMTSPATFEPANTQETPITRITNEVFSNAPFKSSLKTYQDAAYNAAKLSPELKEKLATTPAYLWGRTTQQVIISFEDQTSLEQFSPDSGRVQKLKAINMAIAEATLETVAQITHSTGVKRVYLDQYALFIDADWESRADNPFEVATFPSEARIGARDLLSMGYNGSGVTIAIVDTGIDKNHPDLDDLDNDPATNDPKVIKEASFVDFDNDGINDTSPMDQHGHGTHVAGIAAGNGLLKGVAPQAWLMNARVLDAYGGGQFSWIMNGVNWAASNGADIISMSLGGFPGSIEPLLNDAVNAAWENGIMVVIAAGNSGPLEGTVSSPGLASRAITVGASDLYDAVTGFSSRGPSPNGIIDPDIIAPGADILSTVPSGQYQVYSGTSMATPAVAGGLALLMQAKPTTSIDLIRASILATAKDTGLHPFSQGAGLLDLKGALDYLQAPSVYAYPGFTADQPLLLSPGETFSYQFDIFLNDSFTSFSASPSASLASSVSVTLVDSVAPGWVRATISITMPSTDLSGTIDLKNDTTILYQAPLVLKADTEENDAGSSTDAGETFSGALALTVGTTLNGYVASRDSDFYSFAVTKDNRYNLSLTGLFRDADIFVFDENGTIITIGSNWGNDPELLGFTAKSSGNYYIRVLGYDETPYTLLVTDLGAGGSSASKVIFSSASGQAQDDDSDAKYERLVFSVQVTVNTPGDYDFLYSVAQYRGDYSFGKYTFYGGWITVSLEAGTQTVELSVPGELMAASSYDGAYVLNDLLIGDPSTWTVLEYLTNVTQTPSYANTDFETGLATVNSITYSTYDVNSNNNPEFFTITLDLAFQTKINDYISVFLIDESQTVLVYYAEVYVSTPSPDPSLSVAFLVPGQYLEEFGQNALVAGILLPGIDGLVPLFDAVTNVPTYEPIYTISITDSPTDTDSNGNPDAIRLTFSITSKFSGYLSYFTPSLYSISEERLAVDKSDPSLSQDFVINIGENTIVASLDLGLAAARNIPGPYLLLGGSLRLIFTSVPFTGADFVGLPDAYYDKPYATTNDYANVGTYDKPDIYLTGNVFIQEYQTASDRGYDIIVEAYSKTTTSASLYASLSPHTSLSTSGFYNSYDVEKTLTSGLQNITVRVSGKDIFQARFIGHIEIYRIELYDGPYAWQPIDTLRRAGLIKNADYRNYYDIVPIYATGYELAFVNSDADPLLESIDVKVNVTVNSPDYYSLDLELYGNRGTYAMNFSSLDVSTAGNYSVTISISAKSIVRNGLNGTVDVVLHVNSWLGDWVDYEFFGIIDVNSSEFDYVLPVSFAGDATSKPVDKDGDGLYDEIELSVLVNVNTAGTYTDLELPVYSFIDTGQERTDLFVAWLSLDSLSLQLGQQYINFTLDSFLLITLNETLSWIGGGDQTTFTLSADNLRAWDSEGPFYITPYVFDFPETYDITDFDLTPPLSLDSLYYELVYDINGNAIAINIIIEYTVNQPIDFSLSVYVSASTASDYYSAGQWIEITPTTTGSFSETVQFSFFEIFGSTEAPGGFDFYVSVSAYSASYDFLGSLTLADTIPPSSLTTIVTPTEPENDTTTEPDKKKGFFLPLPFDTVILAFTALATTVFLVRKRK